MKCLQLPCQGAKVSGISISAIGQGKLAARCFAKLCANLPYKFKEIQRGVYLFF